MKEQRPGSGGVPGLNLPEPLPLERQASRVSPAPGISQTPGAEPSEVSRRAFLRAGVAGACALCFGGLLAPGQAVQAQSARLGRIGRRRSPWFEKLSGSAVRCTLCPKGCTIQAGRRGPCRVRENRDGVGYTLVYGNPALVQLDPVERKPFFHVLPGTRALSVSTAGCPIACKFCEVWDMALVQPDDVHAYDLPPQAIVDHARSTEARSMSFAFGEPVAFFEYMHDTAALCREAGLLNLVHTSGYIAAEPLEAVVDLIDAVNIDLKGFDPQFYRRYCDAELEPVLQTLRRLHAAGVHIEITNLLIPTLNDDPKQVAAMCRWIRDELGPSVPLHFARFYPLYKLSNLPPTPVSTLDRARAVARDVGLEYVYVARVTGHEGESTYCPGCGKTIIRRLGFFVEEVALTDGACSSCGTVVPGIWA